MKLVISKPAGLLTPGDVGRFISIDPGLGGTGWATWERQTASRLCVPVDSGSIDSPSAENRLEVRINWVCVALSMICMQQRVVEAVIEKPAFMEGGKGLVAARDGDLVTLCLLTGAIMGTMLKYENGKSVSADYGTHLVPVINWKGNMSKDLTEARVKAKLPAWRNKSKTSHEADAVGLGLFAKGMF